MKEMASVRFIYGVGFKALTEEYKIGVGGNLSWRADLVLAEPSYNVRRAQNDDHTNYDVLESNDMKDMARVLRDMMKPVAHAHVFCSALKSILW